MKLDLSADEVLTIIDALRDRAEQTEDLATSLEGEDAAEVKKASVEYEQTADEVHRQYERQALRDVKPGDTEGLNGLLNAVATAEKKEV